MKAAAWLAIVLGVVLRVVAFRAHDAPRGDVVLDVGVARSLAAGEGFASGYDRALARVVGPIAPLPRQDLADQHAPLWPLLGAAASLLTGEAHPALKLLSLLCGLLLLHLVWRAADRLTEGLPGAPDGLAALATGLAAVSFLLIDAAGSGSLYTAQALLVLVLVELLASPRSRWLVAGCCLGALLLLNHQCVVLLPLPPLVLLAGARPGRRARAFAVGLASVALALACQVPWWLRNAAAFGDPFYSVNPIYFLAKAGVPFTLGLEDGLAVVRFEQGLGPGLALRAMLGFVAPNLLYLLTAGLLVWPLLLGVVAAAWPALPVALVGGRDRRLLAIVLAMAALGAIAVAWPAAKLRYLVSLAPLVLLLGVRLLATLPRRGEPLCALLAVAAWLGLLLLTRDDLLGTAPDPRPVRWWTLCGAGLPCLVLPALLRAWRWRLPPVLLCGLPVSAALALAVPLGPGPGTAYHAAPFLADVFGQAAEPLRARDVVAARWAADVLARAGARRVAGPIELLAWEGPALVELPPAGPQGLLLCLTSLLERGAVDHVVLDGDMTAWLATDELQPLAERLVPVDRRGSDERGSAALVLRVLR